MGFDIQPYLSNSITLTPPCRSPFRNHWKKLYTGRGVSGTAWPIGTYMRSYLCILCTMYDGRSGALSSPLISFLLSLLVSSFLSLHVLSRLPSSHLISSSLLSSFLLFIAVQWQRAISVCTAVRLELYRKRGTYEPLIISQDVGPTYYQWQIRTHTRVHS
jgi:hypothetical protein